MKKQVMKRAWEIRKAAASRFNVKVSEISMSACLVQAWAESKMSNKFNLTEVAEKKGHYILRCKEEDVIRETEKAYGINLLGNGCVDMWVPKSVIEGWFPKGRNQGFVVADWFGKKNMHTGGVMACFKEKEEKKPIEFFVI